MAIELWHILRLRHHINVPRRLVESMLREVDPNGVEQRKHRCLKRRTYVSPGPNFCWHIDGYDKLKPFGFCIHGCVDGFSRRIIWLEVQRSNKNPRLVAKYFLKCVKGARGCPTRVYTDPGTENGLIAGIQCCLRAEGLDEYAGSNSHKYVSSTWNQRIECQWSSGNSGQVGGSTSSMIFMNLTFLTLPVRYIGRHFGFVLLNFFRLILIRLKITGTLTESGSRRMLQFQVCLT